MYTVYVTTVADTYVWKFALLEYFRIITWSTTSTFYSIIVYKNHMRAGYNRPSETQYSLNTFEVTRAFYAMCSASSDFPRSPAAFLLSVTSSTIEYSSFDWVLYDFQRVNVNQVHRRLSVSSSGSEMYIGVEISVVRVRESISPR